MAKKKELRLRHMEEAPFFDFVEEEDRYLFTGDPAKYRFNVIGTGTIGQEHMRVTELEGRAIVHGLFDLSAKSLAVAQHIFKEHSDRQLVTYPTLEAACNDPAADALIICTPNHTHLDVLKVAVQSGKPILLEKPMAPNLADAREIAKIAKDYVAPIQVGLQYRYKATYAEAIKEVLGRKVLGDVKTVSMAEHRPPFLDKVGQWNKFAEKSGGTLVEKCCHYFDLMTMFAGARPTRVFATGNQAVNFVNFEKNGKKSDILDNAFVTVDYKNGATGAFSLNMFSPSFYEELIVMGDEGRLKAFEEINTLQDDVLQTGLDILHGEDAISRRISPRYIDRIETSGHSGATYIEHARFVDLIDGKDTDAADCAEGLLAVLVGAAAELSVATKQPVEIADLINEHDLEDFLPPEK
ncbi:MAG: Gfo/Idh/MocA family oxidoreductase [Kordiimonadaceae bacterium]|nr:Gfo/Idh/MocA family oxidoreductase [Kordiimonadaceae bacterium]MBO6567428.1 Gfo/Idh/MocA family oxidoreductase [Kordiimonadaceae bacterium]MBO6963358.1 Gfo/Idh/MocA family oxidoreductase [Kordiimonadaceae bacterium]